MHWSIGAKIGACFAAVLALLIALGATSYNSTAHFVESAQWVAHTHQVISGLDEILGRMRDAETAERGFLLTGEERYLEPYRGARQAVSANLARLRQLTTDNPVQQRRLVRLEPLLRAKFEDIEESLSLRRQQGIAAATKLLRTEQGKKNMDAVRAALADMQDTELALLNGRAQEEQRLARRTQQTIIAGSAIALFSVLLIGYLLSRNLSGPLRSTSQALRAMAAGDLTVTLPATRRQDEVGELIKSFTEMSHSLTQIALASEKIAKGDLTIQVQPRSAEDKLGSAFAEMGDNLRLVTTETQGTVNILSSAAQQIASTSSQVATAATETDASVSETVRTMDRLRRVSLESAQRAQSVCDNAQLMARVAQNGEAAAQDSIQVMSGIREHMASIAESIVRLSEEAQNIGRILAVVTDIADQLNMLALNALIVATNAGDQSTGFTVVATEVRTLAEESKNAVTEIRALLENIWTAARAAVSVTEQGSHAVSEGMKKSLQAGESVARLAQSIVNAASETEEIVRSCRDQLAGMDQIGIAMDNIKVASSQNVSSTRETEAAAGNLLQLGRSLQNLVMRYTT